jgi:phosphohistidine phosphatase
MELIMIRHGQAEPGSDNKPDAGRVLTASGIKKLEMTMPALQDLTKIVFQAQLWTSPFIRSVQTAEQIAIQFKISEIQYYDFIAAGDYRSLIRELEKADSSRPVILVGHEPFLGDWSSRLCGLRLAFKKGAAAGFEIKGTDPVKAELLWFLQPAALGGITASHTCP